ncbi:MAG: hypothetical protein GY707_18835 [Desulfobacteraceae bacterium]|nr:hypothetical protein [Desulfobacteraceae bacterium]
MNILLFIHQDASKKGDSLKKTIDQNFPETKLQMYDSHKTLNAELKQYSGFSEKEIIVLLADSPGRLDQLSSMIDLMEDKRILLILPDESKETLSKASQFFPRFFTPLSDTYDDLCSVLNKIINQNNLNTNHNYKGEN